MTKSHMLAGAQPSLALQSQNSPSYAPLCSFTEWATKIKLDCHSTYKQVSLVTLHTNRLVWSVTLHTNRLVWIVTLYTNKLVWSVTLHTNKLVWSVTLHTNRLVWIVTLHTNRLVWSVTLHTNKLVWTVTLHTNRLVWSINLFSSLSGHSFYYRCHHYKFRSSIVISIFYSNFSVKDPAKILLCSVFKSKATVMRN